jgi:hypothetical protein
MTMDGTLRPTGLPGYRAPGLQGSRATGLPGYRAPGLQGSRATGLPGYRAPGLQGSRATGLPGNLVAMVRRFPPHGADFHPHLIEKTGYA